MALVGITMDVMLNVLECSVLGKQGKSQLLVSSCNRRTGGHTWPSRGLVQTLWGSSLFFRVIFLEFIAMRDCRGKLYQWVQEGFPEGGRISQKDMEGLVRDTLLTSPTEPAGEVGNTLQIMTRFSPT